MRSADGRGEHRPLPGPRVGEGDRDGYPHLRAQLTAPAEAVPRNRDHLPSLSLGGCRCPGAVSGPLGAGPGAGSCGADPSGASPELKEASLFLPQPFGALGDVGVPGEPEVLGVR